MPIFLASCLILSLILFLAAWLKNHDRNGRNRKKRALGICLVCAVFGAVMIIASEAMRHTDDLLSALVIICLMLAVWRLWNAIQRRRSDLSVRVAIALGVYAVILLWVTLFSRDGSSNTRVIFSLSKFNQFMETGRIGEFRHVVLNILMFMPLGFLLPQLSRSGMNRILCTMAVGIWLSATVESVQYLLVIGQCDLEDVIGNTLGTAIGYGLYRLYRRIR